MPRALIALLLLLGCGASAKQVTGPDGSPSWYEVTCHGNNSACVEKARQLCPNGYEIANRDGQTQRVVSDAIAGEPENGEMLARCR